MFTHESDGKLLPSILALRDIPLSPLLDRHLLATSSHPAAKFVRGIIHGIDRFSVPAPRALVKPALSAIVAGRKAYLVGARVLVCEPLFKGYCTEYGKNLRTGAFLHWVQGAGDIIVGDDVLLDGKISIKFAASYCERPTLRIGSHSILSHNDVLTIGKEIRIGSHCHIASGVNIFDASGHPADPEARRAGKPSPSDEVKPVIIGDNVWIGRGAIIHPGVTIGDHSIVSAGAVVMSSVPPLSIVAGNPARKVGALTAPSGGE
jgi:acetyltransferase-like isoleucine patch superfamily enzyme